MKNRSLRIAIIGAGPSGLASAEALRELGYQNVTVFERNQQAGGMALTEHYHTPDGRDIPYELGSFQPIGFRPLAKYMKKYHIHLGKANLGKSHNPNKPFYGKIYSLKKHQPMLDYVHYRLGMPMSEAIWLLPDVMKLMKLLIRYRKLLEPGLDSLPQSLLDELSIPVETWVSNHHFKRTELLLNFMGSTTTFSNPNFKQTVPALILFKLLYQLILLPQRYINGSFKYVREGYQQLWIEVAKSHNVLYGVNIEKIKRDENGVDVTFDNQTLHFDKLILTCAPVQLLHFLDVTPEEKYVYERVRHVPGWRVGFLAKGLPKDALYAFLEPYLDPEYSQPTLQCFYPEGQVDDETWLYSSVINLSTEEGLEPVLAAAKKLLQREFKGEITEWLCSRYWPEYTPHFSQEDMRAGLYQKLKALQGKNHTFYFGGAISGTSHQEVSKYAEKMVKKNFK